MRFGVEDKVIKANEVGRREYQIEVFQRFGQEETLRNALANYYLKV
jgi:hypothetical protein